MATKTNKNNSAAQLMDVVAENNETVTVNLDDTTAGIKIDDTVLVRVKSNTFGELIYVNSKNGDETFWPMAGDVQVVSMGDLRAMKANQSTFFKNQWIIILGVDDTSDCKAKPADIYRALAITQYYKNLVDPTDFNSVCAWKSDEIKSKVSLLSDGAKDNLIVALNEYIQRGVLESITKIRAFEKALGCNLTIPE